MKKIKSIYPTWQSSWQPENIQDLSSYHVDAASKLEKILSEELAKEIDRDILRTLGIEPDRNKRRMNSINKIFNI